MSEARPTFDREIPTPSSVVQTTLDFTLNELPALRRLAVVKGNRFPREYLKRVGGLGILGVDVPKEYGGQGEASYADRLSVIGIQSYESAGHSLTALATELLFVQAVLFGGTEEHKKTVLPEVISGTKMAFMGMTELSKGSDITSMKDLVATSVKKKGVVIGYKLNGSKYYITNAAAKSWIPGLYEFADYGVVGARTSGVGKDGITAFLVRPKDQPGKFKVINVFNKHGQPGAVLSAFKFKNYFVPLSDVMAEVDNGWNKVFEPMFYESRPGIALQAMYLTKKMIDLAKTRAAERVMQKNTLLKDLPDTVYRFSLMDRYYELQNFLTERTILAKENGEESYPWLASFSKLFCASAAGHIGAQCRNLFGALGFTDLTMIGSYKRDTFPMEVYEGAEPVQLRNMERGGLGSRSHDGELTEKWKYLRNQFGMVDFNYDHSDTLDPVEKVKEVFESFIEDINSTHRLLKEPKELR